MKVAWVSTWDRVCGIADYSKELWPVVQKNLEERGDNGALFSLDKYQNQDQLINELNNFAPDIVHIQHEYSFFGGKNPPLYTFPKLIRRLRADLPQSKILATAHTVIPENYRFPLVGKAWQIPIRSLANILFLKNLRKYWGPRTWGAIHGTITHSKKQLEVVRKAGTPYAEAVPLFVPIKEKSQAVNGDFKDILVFGFFGYEKGQDIAIEAFSYLKDLPKIRLILAGGLREKNKSDYLKVCEEQIKRLGLDNQVIITGYLDQDGLKKYFNEATLVLAPFRSTSGSASITHGLARGLPILASDLPLNLEINERQSGTLEYFKNNDPEDLAEKIRTLVFDQTRLNGLRQGALRYAVSVSPNRIALQHLMVYDNLVK